ncbi:hypothetical protein [Actinoallomurus sp. NPDC052274]
MLRVLVSSLLLGCVIALAVAVHVWVSYRRPVQYVEAEPDRAEVDR